MPWLVSAGIAGMALIGGALGALSIHIGRREDAALRQITEDFVREAAELVEDLRVGRRTLPAKTAQRSRRLRPSSLDSSN